MKTVLIALGSNWISAARLPRVLKEAGCHVSVLCPADWALAHTKFVDQRHDAPGELEAYVPALREHLESQDVPYDWVIIADDPLLTSLTQRYGEGWLASWFPVSPQADSAQIIASKAAFAWAAPRFGIDCPKSVVCTTLEDVLHGVEKIGFPVILKQSHSYAGTGVAVAREVSELEHAFATVANGSPIVVQELVVGQLGNSIALFVRGVPTQWISAFKVRTFPGPFGPSCARQVTDHDDVEPMLKAVGRMTGFHGFGAVDWIKDERTGRLRALEFNARPAPTIHMSARFSVNFADGIRRLLEGDQAVHAPPPRTSDAVASMFPEDVFRALVEGDQEFLTQWSSDPQLRRDVPWDDEPLLAYYLQRRKLRGLFNKVVRSSRETHHGFEAHG